MNVIVTTHTIQRTRQATYETLSIRHRFRNENETNEVRKKISSSHVIEFLEAS